MLALAALLLPQAFALPPAAGKQPHIGARPLHALCSGCRSALCLRRLRALLRSPPARRSAHRRGACWCAVFHLVDDWGWANSGWHANPQNEKEVRTPRMHELVKEGIELVRRLFSSLPLSLRCMRMPVAAPSALTAWRAGTGPRLQLPILQPNPLLAAEWALSVARQRQGEYSNGLSLSSPV